MAFPPIARCCGSRKTPACWPTSSKSWKTATRRSAPGSGTTPVRRFVESARCRHLQICTHFGQTPKWQRCEMCDVCGNIPEWLTAPSEELLAAGRKEAQAEGGGTAYTATARATHATAGHAARATAGHAARATAGRAAHTAAGRAARATARATGSRRGRASPARGAEGARPRLGRVLQGMALAHGSALRRSGLYCAQRRRARGSLPQATFESPRVAGRHRVRRA